MKKLIRLPRAGARSLLEFVRHLVDGLRPRPATAPTSATPFDPQEGQAYLPGAVRAWRAFDSTILDLNWQQDGTFRGNTGRAEDTRHDNVMRAGHAVEALHAYDMTTNTRSLDVHVADLIADLMHLCDAIGEDFETEVQRAQSYYQAEIEGRP